jgi:RimJ/RimL family protein N-acetyltransferase
LRQLLFGLVEPADEPFLIELYAGTRAEEMALVPWSEEQKSAFVLYHQRQHYQKIYHEASHDIILADDRKVGRLYVARLPAEIRIVDITIVSPDRNGGIGTYLLKRLMTEAASVHKRLRIYVESFDPSIRLFERLGFLRMEEQGIHILMERPCLNSNK